MRALLVAAFVAIAGAQNKGAACDRACLESYVDRYLDAVVKHDPKSLPFTRGVKFTENGQNLGLGDGLWNTMSAKGSYHLLVIDPQAGAVTFLGTIKEDGTPAVLALRLKIENRQISEGETFVQRSERSAQGFERIGWAWAEMNSGWSNWEDGLSDRAR